MSIVAWKENACQQKAKKGIEQRQTFSFSLTTVARSRSSDTRSICFCSKRRLPVSRRASLEEKEEEGKSQKTVV